jgi:hypothetical protein
MLLKLWLKNQPLLLKIPVLVSKDLVLAELKLSSIFLPPADIDTTTKRTVIVRPSTTRRSKTTLPTTPTTTAEPVVEESTTEATTTAETMVEESTTAAETMVEETSPSKNETN